MQKANTLNSRRKALKDIFLDDANADASKSIIGSSQDYQLKELGNKDVLYFTKQDKILLNISFDLKEEKSKKKQAAQNASKNSTPSKNINNNNNNNSSNDSKPAKKNPLKLQPLNFSNSSFSLENLVFQPSRSTEKTALDEEIARELEKQEARRAEEQREEEEDIFDFEQSKENDPFQVLLLLFHQNGALIREIREESSSTSSSSSTPRRSPSPSFEDASPSISPKSARAKEPSPQNQQSDFPFPPSPLQNAQPQAPPFSSQTEVPLSPTAKPRSTSSKIFEALNLKRNRKESKDQSSVPQDISLSDVVYRSGSVKGIDDDQLTTPRRANFSTLKVRGINIFSDTILRQVPGGDAQPK